MSYLLSTFHTGPTKPIIKSITKPEKRPIVIVFNKDKEFYGVVYGPWINNGKWDGSYIICLETNEIAYLFPSKFKFTGFTVNDILKRKTNMC